MTETKQVNFSFLSCYFATIRRGGGVSCHPAGGARHQGHGRVLGEAAAAPEGHQPRVEQPHGLHVSGQAGGE